jgi:hypothetical protein
MKKSAAELGNLYIGEEISRLSAASLRVEYGTEGRE